MKKFVGLIICLAALRGFSQIPDSLLPSPVIVHKDFRLDILARKEAELNTLATKQSERSAMGFRLQVLSTNDRELAMRTRTQLLQKFPEQKVYMLYQAPYVKLKFGNFRNKQDTEPYKTQISRMLGGSSIYTLSERIEIKPDKDIKDEDQK
jgi:SPOR domain